MFKSKAIITAIFAVPLLAIGTPGAMGVHAQEISAQDQQLSQQAYGLLKKYCYRCHGVEFAVPGYNVLDRDSMIRDQGEDTDRYISLENPEESLVWSRALVG